MMRVTVVTTILLALLAGCNGQSVFPPPTPPQREPQAPAAQPTTRRVGREVMAYVNGAPVYMDDLYDLLVTGPGRQFALELVRHEMVRQAAEKQNLTVSDKDLQNEHKRFLEVAFPAIEGDAERERALVQLLEYKQVSRKQWDMSIRTAALLRRMAGPEVKISDEDLKEEFARQYGRQVVVRHIQISKLSEAQDVKALAAREDFADLVAKYSINPSAARGGLLPPIGPKTEGVPPAIRQAALAMKEIGEISDPVQAGTTFHILKLEQIIEPKDVKLEDVSQQLKTDLNERRIRQYQKAVLEKLILDARVEYVNPVLKAQAQAQEQPAP